MTIPVQKRWIEVQSPSQPVVEQLALDLNIDKILAGLLVSRGITSFEDAKHYFRPALEDLHPPLLMKDMHRAVLRLQQAMGNGEKILIYGDYDVDGTTAVALVYKFISTFYNQIDFYIPDRYTEGYGISFQGIDFAKKNGFTLIIALDCGIKANDKVTYAAEKGIDFIICDHHLPGEKLPDAIVLDPKRNDCPYPYKELSGCGIGFKFMQAYCEANQVPMEELLKYIDLVAVSTASDIVPITGENRILTYHGLAKINTNPSRGLATILNVANKKGALTVSNLVFIVGPRINAAGRMTTGKHAVELLIAEDEKSSMEFAGLLNDINNDRKEVDKDITTHALGLINGDENLRKQKTTVLFNSQWHKGVIGIVASRLIETYYRPTILFTGDDEKATGSARSVEGFDVHEAIEKCSDLLIQFGGHKYAAGITIKTENIPAFAQRFEEVVAACIQPEMLSPAIYIDAEIESFSVLQSPAADTLPKFYRVLKQMEPFGPLNPIPQFITRNVRCAQPPRLLNGNHIKLTIAAGNENIFMDAIGFGMGHFYDALMSGKRFDMVYSIDENEWNGKTSLQLMVKDLRVKSEE